MTRIGRAAFSLGLAFGLAAASPDAQPVDKSPTEALFSQLGLQAKMQPGKTIHKDLDQAWVAPDYNGAALRGARVAVYLYDFDGRPLTAEDPVARAWAQGFLGSLIVDGASVTSDTGWLGDNWEYPELANSSGPGLGRTMLNMIAQGMMAADTVPKERAALSLEEAKEEKALADQERASLGDAEASARAAARACQVRLQEDARLRHELLGGPAPVSPALNWDKDRDEPLFQAALARDAHRQDLADKDQTPLPARSDWVLVATLGAAMKGRTIFSSNTACGSMVLFHARVPLLAVKHTNKMLGGAFGGAFGQMFTGKGAGPVGVAMTNGSKLADAFDATPQGH